MEGDTDQTIKPVLIPAKYLYTNFWERYTLEPRNVRIKLLAGQGVVLLINVEAWVDRTDRFVDLMNVITRK